jgi:hypothetical protein
LHLVVSGWPQQLLDPSENFALLKWLCLQLLSWPPSHQESEKEGKSSMKNSQKLLAIIKAL